MSHYIMGFTKYIFVHSIIYIFLRSKRKMRESTVHGLFKRAALMQEIRKKPLQRVPSFITMCASICGQFLDFNGTK